MNNSFTICESSFARKITIIPFSIIFSEATFTLLNEDILQVKDVFDIDVQKLLLHHLLMVIFDKFLNSYSTNKILLVDPYFTLQSFEIYEYFSRDQIGQFVLRMFEKCRSKIPVPIILKQEVVNLRENSGETQEFLSECEMILQKRRLQVQSSRQLQKFAKQKGLGFIAEQFIKTDEFKKLLCLANK